jgi:ABC-2 type transport system permease protein
MLWHKTWLDTRIRFFAGLGLMVISVVGIVMAHPQLMRLAQSYTVPPGGGGALEARIEDALKLSSQFTGYVWTQWFRQTPTQLGTLFAVILGSGGLLSRGADGNGLFTLSLPVSRARLVTTRAAVGVVELLAMAVVPALLIPVTAPWVGESYPISAALVHAFCLFLGWTVFFSLALFLSTVWDDIWKPLLLACSIAVALSMAEMFSSTINHLGPFALMSGETFFRTGQLPWIGWLASAVASSAIVYGATVNFTNRDF